MIREHSYGIIPLRQVVGQWQALVIRHQKGHWAFPKGHAEPNEAPYESATRELREETGLEIKRQLSETAIHENYKYEKEGKSIFKIVTYYIAEVEGVIVLQDAEVSSSKWVDLAEAEDYVTFAEGKNICRKVREILAVI